jgi:nickel/cobalt transporter (NicO) family protein
MYNIVIGSILLSVLHALIPNHWLPVLAIGKKDGWSLREITEVTFISGLAHAVSTIAIGIMLGLLGLKLSASIEYFTHYFAPAILIVLGAFFIYQHHRHKHFHLHNLPKPCPVCCTISFRNGIVGAACLQRNIKIKLAYA